MIGGNDTGALKQRWKSLRVLQLGLGFFNETFSDPIYSLKLTSLLISVTGFYFCLKLAHIDPILSFISGCLGSTSCLSYVLVYDRGFQIPVKAESLKREVCYAGKCLQKSLTGQLNRRMIRSVGRLQVIVGGLHALERFSTVMFIAFCFTSVCNLIIGFRGAI